MVRRREGRRHTLSSSCHDFLLSGLSALMRPLALLAVLTSVLAPAAALEVLRAEGSPHDGACGGAAQRMDSSMSLRRGHRVSVRARRARSRAASPIPYARARAAGVGQLVVHRQDGQHGSQTVRSSFSSSRRPRVTRAPAPTAPSRARIPARADASLIRKMVVEVSPHFVDWSGAQLFRILGAPPAPAPTRGRVRALAVRTSFVRSWRRKIAPSEAPRHLCASVDLRATRRRSARSACSVQAAAAVAAARARVGARMSATR